MEINNVKALAITPAAVVSKAVIRATERLDISKTLIAKILGLSPPTISRLFQGTYLLEDTRKEWDFALLFIRMYRSLDSIVGNDQTAQKWLLSPNTALLDKPINLITHTEGLVRVVQYLDASRGIL